MMHPGLVLICLWLAWAVSWVIAARWASTPVRIESRGNGLQYRALLAVGGLLLAIPARSEISVHLWWLGYPAAWLLDLVALAGFAFCWWARLHLGTLWSASVTIKPDHHIIDTGPYGLVRHPIYTGLLLAVLATVMMKGSLMGLTGGAAILVGLVLKAGLEEGFLRQDLGNEAYDAYAGRVPMLVPFLRLG
jgi:protein-S-isoprenylcysteine O-methyltransferase Ste14